MASFDPAALPAETGSASLFSGYASDPLVDPRHADALLAALPPQEITLFTESHLQGLQPDVGAAAFSAIASRLNEQQIAAVTRGLQSPADRQLLAQAVDLHSPALVRSAYTAARSAPPPSSPPATPELAAAGPAVQAHVQTFGTEPLTPSSPAELTNLVAVSMGWDPTSHAGHTLYATPAGRITEQPQWVPPDVVDQGGHGLFPPQHAQCAAVSTAIRHLGGNQPAVTVMPVVLAVGNGLAKEPLFQVQPTGSYPGGYVDAQGATYACIDDYLAAPMRPQGMPIILPVISPASGRYERDANGAIVLRQTEAQPGVLRLASVQTAAAVISGVGAVASFTGAGSALGVPLMLSGSYLAASQLDHLGWQAVHHRSALDPIEHPQVLMDVGALALGAAGLGRAFASAGAGLQLAQPTSDALNAINTVMAGADALRLGLQAPRLSGEDLALQGGLAALNLTAAALGHRAPSRAPTAASASAPETVPPPQTNSPRALAQRLASEGAHIPPGNEFRPIGIPNDPVLRALMRGDVPPSRNVASISSGEPAPTGGTSGRNPETALADALRAYSDLPANDEAPTKRGGRADAMRTFLLWAAESGRLQPGDRVRYEHLGRAFQMGGASVQDALTGFSTHDPLLVSQGRGKPVVVADDARANAALWAARAQRSEALAIALARYAQSEPTSSRPDGRSGTQAVRAFLLWAISNGELQAGDRVRVPQLSKAFDIDSSTAFVALTEFTGDPPLLAHQGAGKPIVVADGASANVTAWASRQQRAEALATALTRYATAGNSQARPESSGGVPAMRMFLIWAIDSGELQAGDPVYLRALSVAFGVDYSTARVALTEFTGDAPVLVGRRNGVPTVVAETARENLADWQAAYEQRKAPALLAALKAYQQTPDYTQPPISSNRSAAVRSFVLWAVESGNLKPGDAVAIGPLASAFGLDRTSTYRALTKFPPGTQVLKSSADGAGMVVATGH